jgi:hypothetical protein
MHFPSEEEEEEERQARTMLNNKSAASHDPVSLSNKSDGKNVPGFFMRVVSCVRQKHVFALFTPGFSQVI